MKTPALDRNNRDSISSGRRELVKGVAVGASLALLLPASHLLAKAALKRSPAAGSINVAMGYVEHGEGGAVPASDVVAAASRLASAHGAYDLRVLGVDTDVSLTMDAHYPGGAHHRFWQAWTDRGLLQRSPTSVIRWWADGGSSLPLAISLGDGAASTGVAARPGIYVLAIGPNAQSLPAWRDLALRPKNAESKNLQLVSRHDGARVTFPYALFSVQQATA